MITYNPLWEILKKQGKKKTDLLEIMSTATLAKLNKNGGITVKTLDEICDFLDCRPEDIIEYKPNKQIKAEQETFKKITENELENYNELEENEKKSILEYFKKAYLSGYNYMQNMPDEDFNKLKKTGPINKKVIKDQFEAVLDIDAERHRQKRNLDNK